MTPNGHERAKPLRTGDPRELGDYRIEGRLGRGGMGTVYLARDPSDRHVAVKLIHPDLSDDDDFRRRFAREVASARRVARFSTAGVLDARLDGDPLFIVSEYVPGPNLSEAIATDGPMFGGTLDSLAMGVAAALVAIHRVGVVHRDLKPANVLLSAVGPKVIDFGIARALDDDTAVTRSSQLMGTPAYLAPELVLGNDVTPASDVFSWGCLVAYAGTGKAPFDAPSVPAVLHRISAAPPDLDGLDPGLEPLVRRALDKDPAGRPTAQQLLNRLVGQDDPADSAVDQSVVRSWTPPSTARPSDAAGAAALAAGAAGAGAADPDATPVIPSADSDSAVPAAPPPPPTGGQVPPTRPMAGQAPMPPSGGYPSAAGQVPSGPQTAYAGPVPSGPQTAYGPPQPGPYGPPGPLPPYPPTAGQVPFHGGPPHGPAHAGPGAPSGPHGPGGPGGPSAPGNGSPPSPRRRTTAIGAGAGAVVLIVVAAIGAVRLFGGGPPEGTTVFQDDFADAGEWGNRSEYDPSDTTSGGGYDDQQLLLIVQSDSSQPSRGEWAPLEDEGRIPENVLVSADARVRSGQPYGEFGVRCFRQEDDDEGEATMYEGLVRIDGEGAQIRRVGGEGGGSEVARADSVPGFAATGDGDEDPAVNTVTMTCEVDRPANTMTINMWVNGRHVLEGVDDRLLPDDAEDSQPRMVGVVAKRGAGGGDNTEVAFDNFRLAELPSPDGEPPASGRSDDS
ncbi:serine/threonine-protein kinase [Nocardiopsis mangrovi]|uniref:Serine/threonine-protein kinase n=1 Tax=Nocardiopsis mangrovi TaxID=1179818 RepID=A0ABV9DRG4_9ACTN